MRQDEARDSLPVGYVWNMRDLIPELNGADASGRGGWAYASPNITTVKATASYQTMVAYAPFSGGAKLCTVDEDGEFYTVASSSSATDIGATCTTLQGAFFYRDFLCIPNSNGSSRPSTYNG